MKAGDIWAGHEYAWLQDKPKGVETPMGAVCVKVVKINRKPAYYGSQRLSTYVDVELLQDFQFKRKGTIIEVRARDIVDHWYDYDVRAREIRENREKAEQERTERSHRIKKENEDITLAFLQKGLRVRVAGSGDVYINRVEALVWLGLYEGASL